MSLQSESRPSTDRRPRDSAYGSRVGYRQPGQEDNQYQHGGRANGFGQAEIPKQRHVGPPTADQRSPNGSSPPSYPPADGRSRRSTELPRDLPVRERSRTNGTAGGKSAHGTLRLCKKCGEPLTGQFVRALGGTFHLECFKCRVRF